MSTEPRWVAEMRLADFSFAEIARLAAESEAGGPSGRLNEDGAGGRNRTDTEFPQPDFESGASTSFATPA